MLTAGDVRRFWSKVAFTESCWLWMGSKSRGYGSFHTGSHIGGTRKQRSAHRLAYSLSVAPVPEGYDIDHTCYVRGCVNPAHLEVVTHHENILRARDRGLYSGENAAGAKFPDADVAVIRDMFDAKVPVRVIADWFNVSIRHVYRLGNRERRSFH